MTTQTKRVCRIYDGVSGDEVIDLRIPESWLRDPDFEGITVLDPDGWDRSNFEQSWNEPITCYEFEVRLGLSTCQYPAGYFKVGR